MQDNGPQPLYVRSKQKLTHEIIIEFYPLHRSGPLWPSIQAIFGHGTRRKVIWVFDNEFSIQEEQNRGKPNWEHLNDELHVLITVEDTENRATLKLERAVDEVKKLLTVVSTYQRYASYRSHF